MLPRALHTLNYGRSRRTVISQSVRQTVTVIVSGSLVSAMILLSCCWWKYYEWYREVSENLETIPGIVYAIEGHGQDLHYHVDVVTILVNGDPRKKIVLLNPTANSFLGTGSLKLCQFGGLSVTSDSFANKGKSHPMADGDGFVVEQGFSSLDLGISSPFRQILPLPCRVQTVQDLVVNYDKLLAAMEQWPREGSVQVSPKMEWRYTIEADTH